MRIIIVGAGAVGTHLAERLSTAGQDVVLVERDPDRAEAAQEQLDVLTVVGNGASPSVLERAGIERADLLLAVTSIDEVNLLACLAAYPFGVKVRVARVSNPEYLTKGAEIAPDRLGGALLINPERECALETFQLLQSEAAKELAFFADGKVQLIRIEVLAEAPVVGRQLAEIARDIKDRRFVTVAILRDGRTIIPRGRDTLEAGDQIYVIGQAQQMSRVYELAGYGAFRLERVMIAGGGRVAEHLARLLEAHGIDSLLIDSDRERCVELAESLHRTLVLHGDATDMELLETEGIEAIDGFVALTGSDDTNMLSSLLAKTHGVKKVVALIQKLDYIPLVSRVGIDAAVSPRLSTVNAILRYVRRGRVVSVASLRSIEAEAIEFNVPAQSPAVGRPVAKLELPDAALIGAIIRDDEVLVPTGQDALRAGDTAILFTLPEAIPELERIFS
ncbi:MAG: Trk system potassium transporter TrkA [Gemmatimonadota bacterium]